MVRVVLDPVFKSANCHRYERGSPWIINISCSASGWPLTKKTPGTKPMLKYATGAGQCFDQLEIRFNFFGDKVCVKRAQYRAFLTHHPMVEGSGKSVASADERFAIHR
jgi:hypothetical protein